MSFINELYVIRTQLKLKYSFCLLPGINSYYHLNLQSGLYTPPSTFYFHFFKQKWHNFSFVKHWIGNMAKHKYICGRYEINMQLF